jgi:hypothetical protein
MIAVAFYCASRLVVARLSQRKTEVDADAVHVFMGAAMAGMLAPRLSPLPASAWEIVFAVAAAWFAWQAIHARRGNAAASDWRCAYPVPHLVECAAMLYMLLATPGSRPGGPPMTGMGESAGTAGSYSVLAVVLALFMLGYIVWTTEQRTSVALARTARPAPDMARDPARLPVTSPAMAAARIQDGPAASGAAGNQHGHPADGPVLAPGLAASYKIAMSITMGYMLIQML